MIQNYRERSLRKITILLLILAMAFASIGFVTVQSADAALLCYAGEGCYDISVGCDYYDDWGLGTCHEL